MKKIGIVTLYDNLNFGNKLQNYAVQTFFEDMGYDCNTIPYFKIKKRCQVDVYQIKNNLIKFIHYPSYKYKQIIIMEKRRKIFSKFSGKYLKMAPFINVSKIPSDLWKNYNYFVVGSDQVWHNWSKGIDEINYFMLKFARKKQKLTISPSFGKNEIESKFKEVYRQGLNDFAIISCREKQGAKLIEELTGKEAVILLDPTMLINRKEWLKIEKIPKYLSKNYIFVYTLGNISMPVKEFINNTAFENKFEVININDSDRPELYLITPNEFIYYIRHAKLVITDSFHASVFSILFNVNFLVIDRDSKRMANMSSRIDTLLEMFGFSSRKFEKCNNNEVFLTDFSKVDFILKNEILRAKKIYQETFRILDAM